MWPLDCWDYGFESRRGHGCISLVSVVFCQVDISATGLFLVQRSPTECVCVCVYVRVSVLLCVIRSNSNPLHLQRVGRQRSN
jgi:hypothetical protein